MKPGSTATRTASTEALIEKIEARLRRERSARREAEVIAEHTTRSLYDKQQELLLLEAVVAASNESSTIEELVRGALEAVCTHTRWPVGHAYVRDPTSGDLVPTAIWHTAQDRFAALRHLAEKSAAPEGTGLPDRVLATKRANWIADVSDDDSFPGGNVGVHGAFALPILVVGQVEAVLECFSDVAVAPDPGALHVINEISKQLGRVAERIRAENQITHQAAHDGLTGLPNRLLFGDRLELALSRAARGGSLVAVLALDLDRFKVVNDSLGHSFGDQLLRGVSRRLRTALRASDTVARFGGDEFFVLCEGLGDESDAMRVAEQLQRTLLDPFSLEGHGECILTTSVGIALGSGSTRDADDLVREADIAVHRAKERGTGRYELFDAKLGKRALERLSMERELRTALEAGELQLHYQPVVTLDGARIKSVEALARWQHRERGPVPPGEFIPIAEESDLILKIGAWSLSEACAQACRWRARFGERAPLPVSVNVSARQLDQVELPEIVAQVLAESGLSAFDLAIEVTETALLESSSVAAASMRELRSLGIKIMLDDFGTGYSWLTHLDRLPIDVLKIDRSFVTRLGAEGEDCAIVSAIVQIAKTLQLELVAEGIESATQAARAKALGCEYGQGYYFGRPVPPPQIESLISS